MILAQLSDTHIVRSGATHFGADTARYLTDALDALHGLRPRPALIVVTGDLVDAGGDDEYAHFARTMARSSIPYVVTPGNHDDRDRLRARLDPQTYGESSEGRIRFARDAGPVRVIGLDATGRPSFPRPSFDTATLDWLEATLAAAPPVPTVLCVHQPPFRTGLHYLDAFGFGGALRFRRIVRAHANVGLVVSGHIHCVRIARIGGALASSAPSTAPQVVPELFERRAFAVRREAPGFALHAWDAERGFRSTVYRRDAEGTYAPAKAAFDAGLVARDANAPA